MERKSQKQIPLEIQVLNRRAMELSRFGKYLDALKIFSQIIFVAPHFVRAHYEMGKCLEYLGRHNEAVERYKKVKEFDSNFIDAHLAAQEKRKNMSPCL